MLQKVVSSHSPSFFNANLEIERHLRYIGFTREERNVDLLAERLAEFEFYICFRSLSVMEMGGNYIYPNQLKQVKQARAVGSPAVSNDDFGFGCYELGGL